MLVCVVPFIELIRRKQIEMRSVTLIIAFITQVHAKDSMDLLMDKLMDKLADRLNESPVLANLDGTTLGKAHPDNSLGVANVGGVKPFLANRPTQPFMGCPKSIVPRTSTVPNAEVKLGSDSGALVFVPDSITIKAGESVKFVNNVGFPHNIVFDEDEVPDGADAEALSKEDYLNAPAETVNIKFDKAGTYGYYCEPHRGAGMKGKIVVQ